MNHLPLIEKLAASATPIRPRRSPGALVLLPAFAVAAPLFYPRALGGWLWIGLSLGTAALARAVVLSAIPGRTDYLLSLRAAIVILAASTFGLWFAGSHEASAWSGPCVREGALMAVFLGGGLSFSLRRLAAVKGAVTGSLLGCLAALGAMALLHWTCASEDAGHVAVSHLFLPFFLCGLGGGLAGRWVFRW